MTNMFNDKHEYLCFPNPSARRDYWVGRLVKAKIPIKKNLFENIPVDTLGLVLYVHDNDDGLAYVLKVRWMTGDVEACYQHDVFSYDPDACRFKKRSHA